MQRLPPLAVAALLAAAVTARAEPPVFYPIEVDGKWGYIDLAGKTLWKHAPGAAESAK